MKNKDTDKLFDAMGGLPVEPKSKDFHDRFWARFEKEKDLPGGTPTIFRLAPSLAGVLVLVVILAGGFWVTSAKDRPVVSLSQGALQTNQLLNKNSEINTGKSEWAIIELSDAYRIKVHPNSSLSLKNLKPKLLPGWTVFHLSKGQAFITIEAGKSKSYPLEIQTENAYAKAMGTQFAVTAPTALSGNSWVGVLKGVVDVGAISKGRMIPQSRTSVQAGHEVYVSGEVIDLRPIQIAEKKRKVLEEQLQFGRQNQSILLISMGPGRVRELLKPCAIYMRIHSDRTNIRQISRLISQLNRTSRLRDLKGERDALVKLEGLLENEDQLDPISVKLFIGAYYAYLNEPDEAVRLFEEIAVEYPNSSYRSLALLAAAKIAFENLQDSAKARRLLTVVLTDHKGSLEISEARRLLGQLPPNESQPLS